MKQVQSGSLNHLGLLFERYHRVLYRFFTNYCGDRQASEDLVQNVFFRILKYRQNYRGDGEFKTWMFFIARNVGHDWKRKKPDVEGRPIEELEHLLPGQDPAPEQEITRQEELQQLKKALQILAPDQRELIELSKLQGLRYSQIGDLLGCTEGNVKVRVFRAMKALKTAFEQLEKQG